MILFGERLKTLRTDRNFSQQTLAEKLSVNQRTISNWEQGTRRPDYELLVAIAEFFDVTTDYLLGRTDY